MSVCFVFLQDERSGILAALEVGIDCATSPVSGLDRFKANRRALVLGRLTAITSCDSRDRALWSVLSEELLVRQTSVVKLVMVVLWAVEELSVSWVHLVVILGELDVEVINPAQLTIDVPLF